MTWRGRARRWRWPSGRSPSKNCVLVSCPDADHAVFEVTCGKGTYVRSLARDMGRKLGCLGHVSMLRRIAVGPFAEADMIPLDKLRK